MNFHYTLSEKNILLHCISSLFSYLSIFKGQGSPIFRTPSSMQNGGFSTFFLRVYLCQWNSFDGNYPHSFNDLFHRVLSL